MTKRACEVSLDKCPGVDYPISNFSSEAPDPVVYYAPRWPRGSTGNFLPGENQPDASLGCDELQLLASEISQGVADALAQVYDLDCTNPNSDHNDPPVPPTPPLWPPYDPWPPPEPPIVPPPPNEPPLPHVKRQISFAEVPGTWLCQDVDFDSQVVARGEAFPTSASAYTVLFGEPEYEIVISVTNGQVPPGLTLVQPDNRLAKLQGTPTQAGVYTFTVHAEVTNEANRTADVSVTLYVLGVTNKALPGGKTCNPYSHQIAATGGHGVISVALYAGSLPPGFILSSDGTLHGITTVIADYNFDVILQDSASADCVVYGITVSITKGVTITNPNLPAGQTGWPYSNQFFGQDGTGPYTFTLAEGILPNGLTLDSDGTVHGTPTVADDFSFTVTVTDSTGVLCTVDCTMSTFSCTLGITNNILNAEQVDWPMSQTFVGSGGSGPYTFTLDSGSLPAGVTLHSNGLVDGTPTETGPFDFDVLVEDTAGCKTVVTCGLFIYEMFMNIAEYNGVIMPLNHVFDGTQDEYGPGPYLDSTTPPYTFSLFSGSLPTGLTLLNHYPSTARFSGTASVAGTYNFVLQIHDSLGKKSKQAFVKTVA